VFSDKKNLLTQENGKPPRHWRKREFCFDAFWPTKMAQENYFIFMRKEMLNRRQSPFNSKVVFNASPGRKRDVAVNPKQNNLFCRGMCV
jgi:hypothetical protein